MNSTASNIINSNNILSYVDGFVAPVLTTNREAYLEHAKQMAFIFKDYGALQVVDCWGDDVPEGKLTSFPFAVKLEAAETAVFSWITWPSRAVRDEGWKKVMEDPRMRTDKMAAVPFDGKRLIYGGFQMISHV